MEKIVQDTAQQMRRSAQLRKSMERLERDSHLEQMTSGGLGRLLALVSGLATVAVVAVLVVDAWLAYDVFWSDRLDGSSSGAMVTTTKDEGYTDLEIFRDTDGSFAGRVSLHNPTERDVWVLVEVDMYDGEQYVGEMRGDVPLKPDSTSTVELSGFDDFVEFTDSRVHLDGLPE